MANIDSRWGDWKHIPEPIPAEKITDVYNCDVAVLGAGIAGVSCALRCAQNGLKVVVLEKSAKWSARGGNIGVSNSSFMKAQGYENDPAELAREWIKRCGSRCDEEILWLYLREGPKVMDWLIEILTRPEYGARPALEACMYQGETYREVFGSHRFFDGPMAKKGLRPGASDAVYAMYEESLKLGVEYLFHCPAVELVKENGRVCAAIGQSERGYLRVNAGKGVVIATGDIGGNDEMCADLAPIANRCAAKIYAPKGGNNGDGHRLGLWAGGIFEETPFPTMMHPQAFHFANYCFLFVDQEGKRYMNEDNAIQYKDIAILRKGLRYAWSILDADWPEKIPATLPYGGGLFWDSDHEPGQAGFTVEGTQAMLERGMRAGTVLKADTLEELAEKMGVPVENFQESVRRINAAADAGYDGDFGKRPELLFRLDKAPYYALKFGPALLAVVGGLQVSTRMEVRDGNGGVVDGLYAIGNAAGGRYGVDYPTLFLGNSHGSALTFGYLLGDILAETE